MFPVAVTSTLLIIRLRSHQTFASLLLAAYLGNKISCLKNTVHEGFCIKMVHALC